jgi:hypothetical protein
VNCYYRYDYVINKELSQVIDQRLEKYLQTNGDKVKVSDLELFRLITGIINP